MTSGIMTGLTGNRTAFYDVIFPDGIDMRADDADDIVITHNKGRSLKSVKCKFLDNAENRALTPSIANQICENPVVTEIDNNSFSINGYIQYGFTFTYEI